MGEPEGFPAVHCVEAFNGPIQLRWEEDAGVSMYGPLTYFIEFLKVSGLWERFVEECPLQYTSRNAPTKNEILGSILLITHDSPPGCAQNYTPRRRFKLPDLGSRAGA